MHMEAEKLLNSSSNLEQEEQSCKHHSLISEQVCAIVLQCDKERPVGTQNGAQK